MSGQDVVAILIVIFVLLPVAGYALGIALFLVVSGPAHATRYIVAGDWDAPIAPIYLIPGYLLLPLTLVAAGIKFLVMEAVPGVALGVARTVVVVLVAMRSVALTPSWSARYLATGDRCGTLPAAGIAFAYLLAPVTVLVAVVRYLVAAGLPRFARWLVRGQV